MVVAQYHVSWTTWITIGIEIAYYSILYEQYWLSSDVFYYTLCTDITIYGCKTIPCDPDCTFVRTCTSSVDFTDPSLNGTNGGQNMTIMDYGDPIHFIFFSVNGTGKWNVIEFTYIGRFVIDFIHTILLFWEARHLIRDREHNWWIYKTFVQSVVWYIDVTERKFYFIYNAQCIVFIYFELHKLHYEGFSNKRCTNRRVYHLFSSILYLKLCQSLEMLRHMYRCMLCVG